MARELGLNPKKFGKLANTSDSPWKVPLAEFIAECYYKAHKRHIPERVRSLEQVIAETEAKKAVRRERKAQREPVGSLGGSAEPNIQRSPGEHEA